LPSGGENGKLSGMGGIFNTPNIALYSYTHLNPIRLTDPDGKQTTGEIIDGYAMSAAASGNNLATYGWAFAATTWSAFGAESLSKVYDHNALGGRTDVTKGDYGWAALDLGVVSGLVKVGSAITQAGAKIIGNAQSTGTLGHKTISSMLAYAHALDPRVSKVTLDLGYKRLMDGVAELKGKWGPRPDVGVLYNDGSVKAIEVMSKTDSFSDLTARNLNKMSSEGLDGTVKVNTWAVKLNQWFGD
jgi:hypothetical protein